MFPRIMFLSIIMINLLNKL